MRLGLKYPERFTSIYAHSSAFRIVEAMNDVDPALLPDIGDADVYRHADGAWRFALDNPYGDALFKAG